MKNVVIIGSGNVASHLIQFILANEQLNLVQIYARNSKDLNLIVKDSLITNDYSSIKEADLYIIAVSDNSIAEVSKNLPFENKLVVHTSGSASLTAINEKNRRGVFYPLQTFTKNKLVNFSEVPFCLETEFEKDYENLEYFSKNIKKL
mgnify:FL=1